MNCVDEIVWEMYRYGKYTAAVIWPGEGEQPADITGWQVEIIGEDKVLTPEVLSAAITDPTEGRITVTFTYASNLPASMKFRLRVITPDGTPHPLPPWRIQLT
jgi:hypothetical protein